MVHSLPRSRAQACRVPISGFPSAWLHACMGSSASTQVMDRLMVPWAGIGSIGFVAAHPAAAARQKIVAAARLKRSEHACCTSDTVARAGYGRTGKHGG